MTYAGGVNTMTDAALIAIGGGSVAAAGGEWAAVWRCGGGAGERGGAGVHRGECGYAGLGAMRGAKRDGGDDYSGRDAGEAIGGGVARSEDRGAACAAAVRGVPGVPAGCG